MQDICEQLYSFRLNFNGCALPKNFIQMKSPLLLCFAVDIQFVVSFLVPGFTKEYCAKLLDKLIINVCLSMHDL